jgi:hypothetical protein
MKRLIFLKIDSDLIPDGLSKTKLAAAEKEVAEQAVKEFKKQVKDLKQVKLIKDYLPQPQALIEFREEEYQTIYEALCQMDIVETVDSIIPEK